MLTNWFIDWAHMNYDLVAIYKIVVRSGRVKAGITDSTFPQNGWEKKEKSILILPKSAGKGYITQIIVCVSSGIIVGDIIISRLSFQCIKYIALLSRC